MSYSGFPSGFRHGSSGSSLRTIHAALSASTDLATVHRHSQTALGCSLADYGVSRFAMLNAIAWCIRGATNKSFVFNRTRATSHGNKYATKRRNRVQVGANVPVSSECRNFVTLLLVRRATVSVSHSVIPMIVTVTTTVDNYSRTTQHNAPLQLGVNIEPPGVRTS